MDKISIISSKNGYRAMFYFKGHIYDFEGKTSREARIKAEIRLSELESGSLF